MKRFGTENPVLPNFILIRSRQVHPEGGKCLNMLKF